MMSEDDEVNTSISENFLEFSHSFGYDCQRYYNFCVADTDTIVFASGSLIHFYNVTDKTLSFRRGTSSGIGHITKNPINPHIAVGETGSNPPIIIYQWPQLKIIGKLINGTTISYSHLAYSPDGEFLVSQGNAPDYLITVWQWKQSAIMLRCKSHSQDIHNVQFSSSIPGHLVTSGAGHVKFWKMAETFTGLKLQGELGRFGKTEISDIIGIYSMPDGKVVSGCEWGNILVWDEGVIKVEVRRKNKKPCHTRMITQFEYNNGELMSIGMDGWIRVWYYETIDHADPPDDNRFIDVEPIYEYEIANNNDDGSEDAEGSMLMSILKRDPSNPEENLWYAQDGNGGFWLIDLSSFESPSPPRQIFSCHAGQITDIAAASWSNYLASFGEDGRLYIYNCLRKKIIINYKFRDSGSRIIWLPCSIESTGSTLVCAFKSGVLRVVTVRIDEADDLENLKDSVRRIQVLKPHRQEITVLSINSTNSLLVTGSQDATVFVFLIEHGDKYPNLLPIGFIKLPSAATCMTWKPQTLTTILTGCWSGEIVEVQLPDKPQEYTKISYELIESKPIIFKFHSVKSAIIRERVRLDNEKKKNERIAIQREKMKQFKALNPAVDIDEEAFLVDTEEDAPLPEIYIPEVPNRVLTINYSRDGTIWLTMAGYDAGYIYVYPASGDERKEPMNCIMVDETSEIQSCLFYNEDKYLILGMEPGVIRVCRLKSENSTDLSDHKNLSMHNFYNNYIPKIILSHDEKMLFTCGHDGNLFSFIINDDDPPKNVKSEQAAPQQSLPEFDVEDVNEHSHPSLEEVITLAEEERVISEAKRRINSTLRLIRDLSEEYRRIMEKNRELSKSQQIPQDEFELDPRITEDLNKQLEEEMQLVRDKMAFKLEKSRLALKKLTDYYIKPLTCLPFAVCQISDSKMMVHSLEERTLGDDFHEIYAQIVREINEKQLVTIRSSGANELIEIEEDNEEQKLENVDDFLRELTPSTVQHKLGVRIQHMLKKYRERKSRLIERGKEWKKMYARKPDPHADHPEDIEAIEEAKRTIGDYKLKVSSDYSITNSNKETTLSKYKQLLDCRQKTHNLREDFNDRLKAVRDKKLKLQQEVSDLITQFKAINAEIPEKYTKPLPRIFEINYSLEFPEENLKLEKYIPMAEKVKAARRIKTSVIEEIIITPMDEEYQVLLLDEKIIESNLKKSPSSLDIYHTIHKTKIDISTEVLKTLNENDRQKSAWEQEMKLARVEKQIYRQTQMINYINNNYADVDKELQELEQERLRIQADSVYSELYQLTLHQELMILKDFESKENSLSHKVDENLKSREMARQKIGRLISSIDQKNRGIAKIHEKIKELSSKFYQMVNDNKFVDFLKRIYRKKYKPPRASDETMDSSSSESTTSSEEDGASSVDSQDFSQLHLDESICPHDCDENLYNSAFTMREKRYEYEQQIKDELKIVENLRREVEQDTKKLQTIEMTVQTSQQELHQFMQEKQRKLNDIDMTVILNLHQLQHFREDETFEKIRNCVIFDKTQLSRLYTRVGELQQETIKQKIKHQKNGTHLHRMEIDCKYMDGEIKRLKTEITQEMYKKFGQEISLSTLYEAVLRRMVYDIKADMSDVIKSYDKEINCVREKYVEQVRVLETLIQDNTEKLSLLTILDEEQSKLRKILHQIPQTEENMQKIEEEYEKDLSKLEAILKNQRQQKRIFRNEIRNLRLKSRPLPPICPRDRTQFRNPKSSVDVVAHHNSARIQSPINLNKIISHIDQDSTKEQSPKTMIRRLLSKISDMNVNNRESEIVIQDLLQEFISHIPCNTNITEIHSELEESVKNIVDNEELREIILDNLNELMLRIQVESRGVEAGSVEISWDVKPKIDELLDSMNIKKDVNTGIALMKFLEAENGVENAAQYLLTLVSNTTNTEAAMAFHDHALQTLREIKLQISDRESTQDERSSASELP